VVKEIDAIHHPKPMMLELPSIPVFQYEDGVNEEAGAGRLDRKTALELLEQMLMIRALEEMIAELKAGAYQPLLKFNYVGPTHISIGQEATSTGAVAGIRTTDYITSSHRGHGDAMAKGYTFIKGLDDVGLRARLEKYAAMIDLIGATPASDAGRAELEEAALRLHTYRMIAELFGKSNGYCRGVGGSMHIADFESGHLGANAIVGGHMGIAAGAGIGSRYKETDEVTLCFAGDGAYQNGISHESITMATMAQFHNGLMTREFGVPVIFAIVNNQYAMSGQSVGETTALDFLARQGAGYHVDALHAEVVDGMNVLAVREAIERKAQLCREGHGPTLIEIMTYRYKGHSLSDAQAYRDRSEVEAWMERDPTIAFPKELLAATFPDDQGGPITEKDIQELTDHVWQRNAEMSERASASEAPHPDTILLHMFREKADDAVPDEYASPKPAGEVPTYERKNGCLSYRFAIREALAEEMLRDERVVLYGEDIAEYGGAFAATGGLLAAFGRDRVFNAPISESAIVGTAVGMAMTGLRPVCEIMYDDFILMTMDQTGNQAAKWSYMSGGQKSVPMVIRTPHGGGRGYAGQHSQCLETICLHMPGLIVICPSDAYDAKGLLKSAIRDPNPVVFFEHQWLYGEEVPVPEEEYLVPIGKGVVKREGTDATVVAWGWPVRHALKAAEQLQAEEGISIEVVDPRTLWPLDMDIILTSVRKTGRCLVTSQAVSQASFTGEVASRIMAEGFDYLDAPVMRLGAPNGVSPSAQSLEMPYLVDDAKIIAKLRELLA